MNLIGNTRTDTGLEIHAELDENAYPTAIQVSHRDRNRAHILLASPTLDGIHRYALDGRIDPIAD